MIIAVNKDTHKHLVGKNYKELWRKIAEEWDSSFLGKEESYACEKLWGVPILSIQQALLKDKETVSSALAITSFIASNAVERDPIEEEDYAMLLDEENYIIIESPELLVAEKLFDESIEVARRAGVPEEKILKTKEDIDSYFS